MTTSGEHAFADLENALFSHVGTTRVVSACFVKSLPRLKCHCRPTRWLLSNIGVASRRSAPYAILWPDLWPERSESRRFGFEVLRRPENYWARSGNVCRALVRWPESTSATHNPEVARRCESFPSTTNNLEDLSLPGFLQGLRRALMWTLPVQTEHRSAVAPLPCYC